MRRREPDGEKPQRESRRVDPHTHIHTHKGGREMKEKMCDEKKSETPSATHRGEVNKVGMLHCEIQKERMKGATWGAGISRLRTNKAYQQERRGRGEEEECSE